MKVSKFIQILFTINSEEKANEIAKKLLEQRAVSCMQIIGPTTSSYWWKNQIQQTIEWVCLAKSKEENFEKIESIIKSLHPFKVPDIVAIPISTGNRDYLKWIQEETTHKIL